MPTVQVSKADKDALALAARMAGVSEGEIIHRLITAGAVADEVPGSEDPGVVIYGDYAGHRTAAVYYIPGRVGITDGPLAGASFASPSGAARAIVHHYNPAVSGHRHGWTFWRLRDGDATLESIRP